MILKSKMKVYRYSSKIEKSEAVGCRSGLRLGHMKLSVGIYILTIASLFHFCIGGTGTFTLG